jgi:phosphatidylinositol 4-kinase A
MIQSNQSAQKLVYQLIPYILEAHVQVFVPSPFFKQIEPSATEALTFNVTAALLSLGINYHDLQETVADSIWAFTSACGHATESIVPNQENENDDPSLEDAIKTARIALSMLGLMDAAAAQADFWRSGGRLALIKRIYSLLSEPFLVAVETALSTIRNSHSADKHVTEWKRHLKHYAAIGRPLGSMLLQRSLMRLLVAATSLLVADASVLRGSHILDLLMSGESQLRPVSPRNGDADYRSVETYANMAVDQMNYLEASADFIRLGSSWQQRLAFAVKSGALISYLNCSLLNEDAADAEILMSWLEEILTDPLQMADETLASVVLRSMALICKISPAYAATVSRLLPRFIVQSAPHSKTVAVASKSLASVLQVLSHDSVITTLYTLGNVLSPGADRAVPNGTNGDITGDGPGISIYAGRHSTGSSISLQINGEEETAIVHGNVVQAICGVASVCNDEKITALAQSMLLQKIDKVNNSVDAHIITGAAVLALKGGQLEFRSLLKTYSRICHHGVVQHKDFLLTAVSTIKLRRHERGLANTY